MFWPVRIGSIVAAIGGCLLLQMACSQFLGAYPQRLVVLAGLYVTLAVSLNLINGITGQFSMGHAAFYQVGAYTAGFLSVTFFDRLGLAPFLWLPLMMLVAAVAAGLTGFIVGLPSLRLKGDYLAVVTLGFGEIIRILVNNMPHIGGSYGMNVEPKIPTIAGVWLLAILCIAVCRNLLKTAHGLPFLSVREDEIASSAMGVNVTRVKVAAFVLGSMFAGAAGAMLAHYEGFISPRTFAMDVSFIILTMVVLGGTGSITGSVLGAIFLSYLPEYLRDLKGPGGEALTFSGGDIVACFVGIVLAVALLRRFAEHPLQDRKKQLLRGVGVVAGGIAVAFVLQFVLDLIPALAKVGATGDQLRMVIFAVVLIVLMLLRPQGVFAHHEFSWSWVRKVLGSKNEPQTAVSA